MPKSERLFVRIPPDLLATVKEEATAADESLSRLARRALTREVERRRLERQLASA